MATHTERGPFLYDCRARAVGRGGEGARRGMPIRIINGRGMLDCLADAARGSRALALGFEADASFDGIIAAHVEDEFSGRAGTLRRQTRRSRLGD